ncbi:MULTISPECIES: hypothetical protein [unclassified Microbacterium]|uniref:hypothetical protein n=1 Tax=unclassified Microbacterium TaxID=2609290 RepID=UPI00160535B0|nr:MULTISPECIES: hypothetical protein [unclassified Microbacterium]QNA91413.1 hypothetical protein G4G29_01315 [Microbacterium sp. Se63.02b]QYM64581.1 hypothetical protein K1X59_01325 [Microbacterium sp. Se5.02b]
MTDVARERLTVMDGNVECEGEEASVDWSDPLRMEFPVSEIRAPRPTCTGAVG